MTLTPFDILHRAWAGQAMACRGTNLPVADEADFASRVEWAESNSLPKPTLAEVEARRAEIEALVQDERKQARQREELMEREDRLLLALEILSDAVADLQAKVRTSSVLDSTLVTRVGQVRTRLAQIRAGE